jgi:hypothetical protein
MKTVEDRLAVLERSLSRWKVLSMGLVCGLMGVLACAAGSASVQDVVRCHQIEVVNGNGAVVTRIETLPKDRGGDGGWITCFSNDGKLKVRLGAQVGGDGQLDVMSGADNVDSDVTLNASPEGGGQITLNGPNQSPYVKIAAPPGRSGQMSISNKTGATIWHAPPQ